MSNLRGGGLGERTAVQNHLSRGNSEFRGRSTGRGENAATSASSTGGREEAVRLRPTHFLALPLNNYPSLMTHINTFHRALFSNVDGLNSYSASYSTSSRVLGKGKGSKVTISSLVGGLDSSIIVDPRRLHMTLGVMALEQDDGSAQMPMEGLETTIPTTFYGLPDSASTTVPMTGNLQLPASAVSSIEPTPSSLPASRSISSHRSLSQSQPLSPLSPPFPQPTAPPSRPPKKTVSTALYLLNSLKPRISEILDGDKGIKIPLNVLHALKTEKMWMNTKEKRREAGDKEMASGGERNEVNQDSSPGDPRLYNHDTEEKEAIGAGVLYVAPDMKNQSVSTDLLKLIQVTSFVHQAFKDAGYLTDTRPLKLHCTILNTSYRRPFSRRPFSYSDILVSGALRLLCGNAGDSNSQSVPTEEGSSLLIPEHELEEVTVQEGNSSGSIQRNLSKPNTSLRPKLRPKSSYVPTTSQGHSKVKNPPSVSLNLGVFVVEEIQLWVMGSHGPNNEYVSCGGVLLE